MADPATEAILDSLAHQVTAVLEHADSRWAKAWRGLRTGEAPVVRSLPQPGIAMRVVAFELDAVRAPHDWASVPSAWAAFLAALDAGLIPNDAHQVAVKALFTAVAADQSAPDWQSIGIPVAPLVPAIATDAPPAKPARSRKAKAS